MTISLKSEKLYLILFLLLIVLFGCKQSEESKVKETCNRFIKGRIALRDGDSSGLKAVTEDSLFTLLMLREQYAAILNAPIIRADLNICANSVKIKGDCATCVMSGEERYNIHLCKYDGTWKVKGENDIYPTTEMIARSQEKDH